MLRESDRQILGLLLSDYDRAEQQKKEIERLIKAVIAGRYQEIFELLQDINGVGPMSAHATIGEIGDNMEYFPSPDHLTSWVGVASGNNNSAGKMKMSQLRRGISICAQIW